jgi:hypothetical protein
MGQACLLTRCGGKSRQLVDCGQRPHRRARLGHAAKSSGWDENRFFLEGDKLEVAVKNGRWGCSRTCPQARDRRWAAAQENRMLFAHLKRILKLDRLRLRGPNGARDEFLLAATAQNLRKLAKLIPAPNLKPA